MALPGYVLVYVTNTLLKPKLLQTASDLVHLIEIGLAIADYAKSGLKTYSTSIQLSSMKDGFS